MHGMVWYGTCMVPVCMVCMVGMVCTVCIVLYCNGWMEGMDGMGWDRMGWDGWMHGCMHACMPVCQSVCQSVSQSVCQSVCLSVCLFIVGCDNICCQNPTRCSWCLPSPSHCQGLDPTAVGLVTLVLRPSGDSTADMIS